MKKFDYSEDFLAQVKILFDKGFGERRIGKILNINRGIARISIEKLNLTSKDRTPIKGKDKMDVSNGKLCTGPCKQVLSIENFKIVKYKNRSDGYCPKCIKCQKEYHRIKHSSEHAKNKRKEYRKNNREKLNKIAKDNLNNNPILKLRNNVRNAILKQLFKSGVSKNNASCVEYLPFKIEELKNHLEKLFSHPDNLDMNGKIWMNWENHGAYKKPDWDDQDSTTWVWQIDHIIPHSEFLYLSMDCDEFRKCWDLSNLRPLCAKKNQTEGGKKIRHKKI